MYGAKNIPAPTGKNIAVGIAVDLLSLCVVYAVSYGMPWHLSKFIQQQQLPRTTNHGAKKRLTKLLTDQAEYEAKAKLTNTDSDDDGKKNENNEEK